MESPKGLIESASVPSFASAQPGGPWVNRRDHLVSVGKTVAQPPLNEAAAVAWKARRKARCLKGERLQFRLFSGTGPLEGPMFPAHPKPEEFSAEADGNAALQRGPARGLVLWRWHRLEAALEELERKDDSAQLALQLALGRWPEAQLLAKKLQLTDAERVVDSWMASTNSGRFSPSPANFEEKQLEVMPGLRQVDGLIAMEESVQLGVRLYLRCPHGKVETSRCVESNRNCWRGAFVEVEDG
eukprot:symbB.v1.2.006944.t1/scaffold416.1/size293898/3